MARKGIKPSYKWVGNTQVLTIKTAVSTAIANVLLPIPALASLDSDNDVLFERMFVDFSIRRLTTGSVVALGVVAALQKADAATGLPTELLDPLTTNAFALANRDILAISRLPVPPVILGAGDALRVSSEVVHTRMDVKVRRRFQRANHVLSLTITADLSDAVEIATMTRCLLRLN